MFSWIFRKRNNEQTLFFSGSEKMNWEESSFWIKTSKSELKFGGCKQWNPTAMDLFKIQQQWSIPIFSYQKLVEVMTSLGAGTAEADSDNCKVAKISKYINFCIVILKMTNLISDGIFNHYANDFIFMNTLQRKF